MAGLILSAADYDRALSLEDMIRDSHRRLEAIDELLVSWNDHAGMTENEGSILRVLVNDARQGNLRRLKCLWSIFRWCPSFGAKLPIRTWRKLRHFHD